MKIAFIMGAYSFGGAERVMCALANHFSKSNDVVLITIFKSEETYSLSSDVKRINGVGCKNDLDGIIRLRKIIRKEKPEIVVSFITHINIAAILADFGTGIPLIVSERNDPSKSATSSVRKLLRRLTYPFASGVVFQTEDAKKYFSSGIQKKSTIIPNPLFLETEPVPFEKRRNEIVSVGRYVPQKRQDLIIEAFAKNSKNSDYKLILYGNGEEKNKLQDLAASLGVRDRVYIYDAVKDLHERIKFAKIFIMMSEYEGMPNALMEAMGLGLACICSDCPCGGPRFLIDNGNNGFLVNVNDIEDLSNRLRNLLGDEKLMRKIGNNAINIRDRLSPDVVFKQWEDLLINNARQQ